MNLVKLRQFDQSLLATDGVERHLERRRAVAPWSSAHALASFRPRALGPSQDRVCTYRRVREIGAISPRNHLARCRLMACFFDAMQVNEERQLRGDESKQRIWFRTSSASSRKAGTVVELQLRVGHDAQPQICRRSPASERSIRPAQRTLSGWFRHPPTVASEI